jgi:hypothetical protein
MDSRAFGVITSAVVPAGESSALARIRKWHAGWVRYHEARYQYLDRILDCAAVPCCELPRLRQVLSPTAFATIEGDDR